MPTPIVIAEYDPGWPDQFELIKAQIAAVLGDLVVAIEHVGSTSVPGLAAKPIIDLDIAIAGETAIPEAIRRLGTIGYVHEGDLGITGREAFSVPDGSYPHHPYLVTSDGREFKRHIAFRDRLRRDENTRQEYEALKRRLALEFRNDGNGYSEAKSALIHPVLAEELGTGH